MPGRRARERIEALLEAICIGLGVDLAFIGEFEHGRRVFRFVSGSLAGVEVIPGGGEPLDESYCYYIARGEMPEVIPDASLEPSAQHLAATEHVGSHVGVAIHLPDGRLFGTVCAASSRARPDFDERTVDYLRNMVPVIARELEEVLEEEEMLSRRSSRVRHVIDRSSFQTYLQPIVDLQTARTISVEALTRFTAAPYRSPPAWFGEAWDVGLGTELELAAAERAATYLTDLAPECSLAINVSAVTLSTKRFIELCAPCADRLVVEVTEHSAISDYENLVTALRQLRQRGIKLAVDDVGSGYASLSHILELKPDLVKLDVALTRAIEDDPSRQALVAAMVTFTSRIGAELVAEGIETVGAATVLRDLGVRAGQGFLLREPAPAEVILGELSSSELHSVDGRHVPAARYVAGL